MRYVHQVREACLPIPPFSRRFPELRDDTWRLLCMRRKAYAFLLCFLDFMVAVGASSGVMLLLKGRVPDWLGLSAGTAVLIVLYLLGNYWIERRKPVELHTCHALQHISTGLAIGIVSFASVIGILSISGAYRFLGLNSPRPVAPGLLLALVAAIFEEIAFRGFLFRLFAGVGGNWAAIVLTAALFGLSHNANSHATLASSGAVAVEAGILLGAAYAASGSLWLPIGIHAGWNFAEGSIFGMAVSGNNLSTGFLTGRLRGPTILTGGSFGPEASLVAVAVCCIPAMVYLRKMRKAETQVSLFQPALAS
jgi:membrane protease YdiL (CAAX protease family)